MESEGKRFLGIKRGTKKGVNTAKPKAPLKERMIKTVRKNKYLWLLLAPGLTILLLFKYAPMTGLYMSFVNYAPSKEGYFHDLLSAPFVGWDWFKYFFENDFFVVMRNTLGISLLTLLISFPIPILIAVFLNDVSHSLVKKGIQTAAYFPYFISWVIAANMMLEMFSGSGIINQLLQLFHITDSNILFFQEGKYFWWLMAISNTWKTMGYNAIVFLAAISGINTEQYEAAKIDGAARWQQLIYVTLPAIKSTIIVMLILAVGNVLNTGFEQILLLQNQATVNYSEVIDTYTYRYGMQQGMYSYGTAVGLFRSVVAFVLVVGANKISRKANQSSLY